MMQILIILQIIKDNCCLMGSHKTKMLSHFSDEHDASIHLSKQSVINSAMISVILIAVVLANHQILLIMMMMSFM